MGLPPAKINAGLIAPCGMNCGICLAYLREKNPCRGCRGEEKSKPHHCRKCIIKNCEELAETDPGFCFSCGSFPCPRLFRLDKRYRTRYQMSMLENLESIRSVGLARFVETERVRWTCGSCGGTVCVHRGRCLHCGEK